MTGRAVTWDEIVDHCSRLHTTRQRPVLTGSDMMREGSRMWDVTVNGRPAQIVPTRMHEPGFYWRYIDVAPQSGLRRSDVGIEDLRRMADAGLVLAEEALEMAEDGKAEHGD